MGPDEFWKANVRFTCCAPSREWLLSIPVKEYLTHELTPVHTLGRRNRIRRQRDEEMKLTTNDIRKRFPLVFGWTTSGEVPTRTDFDEWLESHDAEVRNEAIIARDTRTPAELIQAAWKAAYPVPANGRIPKGTKCLTRYVGQDVVTAEAGCDLRGGPDIRTLDPLPPVIPDGTPAVWASTSDGIDTRRVLVLTEYVDRTWRDGEGDTYHDDDLIDPVPIPEEVVTDE